MALTTIRIDYPFSFTDNRYGEFKIGSTTTVNNILRLILENRKVDIANYGIFVKPQNKWLVPELCFSDYQSVLANEKTVLEFRSKNLRKLEITYLTTKVTTWCDPSQPLKAAISFLSSKVSDSYFTGMTTFSLVSDTSKLIQDGQISAALYFLHEFSVPTFNLLRLTQIPSTKAIFNGTIDGALSVEPKGTTIPVFFDRILSLVEEHRDIVGIYRLSGNITVINEICQHIENSSDANELDSYLAQQKPVELACVAKQYLRQLSEPLIPTFLEKKFRNAFMISDYTKRMQILKHLLKCLPPSHYNLFSRFCEHIEVIYQSTKNQMNPKNLAICMGTNILRASQGPNLVGDTKTSQDLIQLIFEQWRFFFKDEGLNLAGDEAILKVDIKEGEKSILANTQVKIIQSIGRDITVKFNDIEIETEQENLILNRPNDILPFEEYTIVDINDASNSHEYLLPDNDPIHSVLNIGNHLQIKMKMAQEIESQLSFVIQKLRKDPTDEKALHQFTALKNKFNKL